MDQKLALWTQNAADARATATLITDTIAVGNVCKLGPVMLKEVKHLMATWASLLDADTSDDGGCLLLHDVHFAMPAPSLPGERNNVVIFEGLSVHDHTVKERPSAALSSAMLQDNPMSFDPTDPGPLRLPAGRMIGLRSVNQTSEGRTAEHALLNLLHGRAMPSMGLATCVRKSALVGSASVHLLVFGGSLKANLLYAASSSSGKRATHVTDTEEDRIISDQDLWELCRRAGISSSLIGSKFAPGWAEVDVSLDVFLDEEDLVKVCLVRQLLTYPDALLLYRIGENWPLHTQLELYAFVRSYLDGTLSDVTHNHLRSSDRAGARANDRTVLIAASNETRLHALNAPGDLVLTLESKSRAVMSSQADAASSMPTRPHAPTSYMSNALEA